MNKEYTITELELRELSEKSNPYHPECPNMHLWSEGFRAGYHIGLKACIEDYMKLREAWEAVKMLRLDEYHTLKASFDQLLEINSELIFRLSWSNTFISNENVLKNNQESLVKANAFIEAMPKREEEL